MATMSATVTRSSTSDMASRTFVISVITTAIKYRVNIGPFRIGALAQVGGYNLNNGSNGNYEAQIGGDIPVGNFGWGNGVLALDAIYKWEKDAVNLSLSGVSNVAGVPVAPFLPQTLTATISNNQNVMLLSKYTVGPLKLYAGYEWYQLAPPSDPVNKVTGFTDIGGLPVGSGYNNLTAISNIAYSAACGTGTCSDKVMQSHGTRSTKTSMSSVPTIIVSRIPTPPPAASILPRTRSATVRVRRRFRPGRLAVSAEVGRLYWCHVLVSECRSLERLSRSPPFPALATRENCQRAGSFAWKKATTAGLNSRWKAARSNPAGSRQISGATAASGGVHGARNAKWPAFGTT
jgi:hypothetical protein